MHINLHDAAFNVLNRLPSLIFFSARRERLSWGQCWRLYRQIMANMESVPLKKRTDTLAIMGSGPSINELTQEDIAFLNEVDVLAFNLWAYHDLVPQFYIYEAASDPKIHDTFFDLMDKRQTDYRDVVFLAKCVPWFLRKGNLAEEFNRFPPSLISRIRLLRMKRLKYYNCTDFDPSVFRGRRPIHPQIQSRGTVTIALSLAYAMSYEQVILYGIDMSAGGHFWENRKETTHDLHSLAQLLPDGALGLIDVIRLYRENLFVPHNKELFIASKSSHLYPHLPLWNSSKRQ